MTIKCVKNYESYPIFRLNPFLRKLKGDTCCQSWIVLSALGREYIDVMLNMDQESWDNNGNKSDMRLASKFQGLGIKFHHLWHHIFLSFILWMPCEKSALSQTWLFYFITSTRSIALLSSSWKGFGQIWFYSHMNGNKYHLYFNPSIGEEAGAGK